ncbi:MAG: hypothetical protein WEA56_09810 [Balneolaceae bacterium]
MNPIPDAAVNSDKRMTGGSFRKRGSETPVPKNGFAGAGRWMTVELSLIRA